MGCFKEINVSSRLRKHKQTQTTDLWKLPASWLPGCCGGAQEGRGRCSRGWSSTELSCLPEIWRGGGCTPSSGHTTPRQFLVVHVLSLQDSLTPQCPVPDWSHRLLPSFPGWQLLPLDTPPPYPVPRPTAAYFRSPVVGEFLHTPQSCCPEMPQMVGQKRTARLFMKRLRIWWYHTTVALNRLSVTLRTLQGPS